MPRVTIKDVPFKRREKALETVLNRTAQAVKYQKPLFEKFITYYQIYRAVRNRKAQNYQGQANLVVPYVYANIENAYPKLIAAKPRLNILPREDTDTLNAEVNEKMLDYQWYKHRMKAQMKDWVKQGLIYGVSPLKVTWMFDKDKGGTNDHIQIDLVNVYDFFVDPDATSPHNARFMVHQLYRNVEELRKNPRYKIPRELKNTSRVYTEYETQLEGIKGQSKETTATNEKVKLWEYWGLFDINGDGIEEECLIVVANEQYLIRLELNPYQHSLKPFAVFRDIVVPNEFWAMGEVEPIISLQYELNDIRNQRMDNVTQILKNMPIISRQANVRAHDIRNWQNGNVLEVDGPAGSEQAIAYSRPPDVTSSSYNEETLVKADLQFVSSLAEQATVAGGKNIRSKQQETATGAALAQEETNARFRAKLDNLEDSMADLGNLMIGLNQQFITTERVIRVINDSNKAELFTVKPEDIKGRFDLIVEAGATQAMNKQVRRREALELYNALAPIMGAIIDPKWLVKNILQSYDIPEPEQAFMQGGGPQQAEPAPPGVPEAMSPEAGRAAGPQSQSNLAANI